MENRPIAPEKKQTAKTGGGFLEALQRMAQDREVQQAAKRRLEAERLRKKPRQTPNWRKNNKAEHRRRRKQARTGKA